MNVSLKSVVTTPGTMLDYDQHLWYNERNVFNKVSFAKVQEIALHLHALRRCALHSGLGPRHLSRV